MTLTSDAVRPTLVECVIGALSFGASEASGRPGKGGGDLSTAASLAPYGETMRTRSFVRCWGYLLATLWFLGGCDENDSADAALEQRSFLLESAEGFEPLAGTTVSVGFRNGEFGFSAGCNGHGGTFSLRDERLVVTAFQSTTRGCDAALHAQDEWLAGFLTSSPSLKLEGERLTLRGAAATLVFLDREVADPDRPLVGTLWTVDTIVQGDFATSSVLPAPAPSILFREDGTLQVDTTCNTGSGRYSVAGDQLTLTPVSYTLRACSGASDVDDQVQVLLREGTLTFEIEATRLTLRRGDSGLSARGP